MLESRQEVEEQQNWIINKVLNVSHRKDRQRQEKCGIPKKGERKAS